MINVITSDENEVVQEYPRLMIHFSSDIVVIFTGPNEGIIVSDSKNYNVCEYRDDWVEDSFKLFTGKITLSNKD